MNETSKQSSGKTDPESDPWVMRLRSDQNEIRDTAIADLRELLIRGLTKAMGQRYGGGLQPEDVVQEALVKILDSLDQFAGRSRFTTWAMTVANRVGISEMRRKHYQDVSLEGMKGDVATRIEIAVDDSPATEVVLDRQAMVAKLQQIIDEELTEKQRLVIRASLEGLPVEVIAEKYGGNRNSVYKLVHDARTKLRHGLEKAGIAAEDFATTFA